MKRVLSRGTVVTATGIILVAVLGATSLAPVSASAAGRYRHVTPPSCATIAPLSQIEAQIPGPPALVARPVIKNTYSLWVDGANDLRGPNIPSTKCVYDWNYTDGHPQGDPDPYASSLNLSSDPFVFVGSGVTMKEWNNIRNSETDAPGTQTDGCSGECDYLPPQTVRLGVSAFVLAFNETAGSNNPSTAPWADVYELYILTHNHNILEISTWPMSLTAEENYARAILDKYAARL